MQTEVRFPMQAGDIEHTSEGSQRYSVHEDEIDASTVDTILRQVVLLFVSLGASLWFSDSIRKGF